MITMIDKKAFIYGLSHCDVFFEGEKISHVSVVEHSTFFLTYGLFDAIARRRTLLHNGSPAYDAMAVFLAALANLTIFYENDEDFLSNLNPGDIVYNTQHGRRERRKVVEIKQGEFITLLERPKTNGLLTLPWSKTGFLEPYKGTATKIGGTGIPQAGSRAREEFFKYAFMISPEDIPRTSKSYTVVVASHEYSKRLYTGIEIEVRHSEGKTGRVKLSDLVGGIYATNEQNISLGGALSNDRAVLRFCSSLSQAKDLLREAGKDEISSLLVVSNDAMLSSDAQLFDRLSSLRKKNFVFTSIKIGTPADDYVMRNVGEGKLFSHTKQYLRKLPWPKYGRIGHVGEIWSQIKAAVERNVKVEKIEGFINAERNAQWLSAVKSFKMLQYDNDEKGVFLDSACGLFAFLRGAVFDITQVDAHPKLVWRGRPLAPVVRIENLKHQLEEYPPDVREAGEKIVRFIIEAYNELKAENPKFEAMEKLIETNKGKNIAVIVPQEGFRILFERLKYYARLRRTGGSLTVATPNSFGRGVQKRSVSRYDLVVSIGGAEGRRFSPFSCTQANNVVVLLYPVEAMRFIDKEKDYVRKERVLNNQSTYQEYETSIAEAEFKRRSSEGHQFELELADFLKQFREREDRRLAESYGRLSGNNRSCEVVKVGTLDSGEKIFFTRHFRPYVVNDGNEDIRDVELSEVSVGDTLLFTQNNEASKDIVDVMLADYIKEQESPQYWNDCLAKTKRWRQILRDYAEEKGLNAVEIASRMQTLGASMVDVTIRNWMDEDSHIVGPRLKDSLVYIAKLTADEDLRSNIDKYFEACRKIRERRVKLLHRLSSQIRSGFGSDDLGENENSKIANKLKHIVKLCVIESIVDVSSELFMSAVHVNRPVAAQNMEDA